MGILEHISPSDLPEHGPRRHIILGTEGTVHAALALCLMYALGLPQGGALSIFLIAASLTGRTQALLDENRDNIWVHDKGHWPSNALTATSMLALFLGVLAVSAVATGLLGEQAGVRFFGFLVEEARLGNGSLDARVFGGFAAILGHNAAVMATLLVLAFIYRTYGALLALIWNAVVWAFVLTTLLLRSEETGAASMLLSACAIMPHLVMEGAAYIVGALAAIFLSRGLTKYPLTDPRLKPVMVACAKLIALAMALLVAAAAFEAQLTPRLLSAIP